jgi:hypothetical protein
MPQPRSPSNTDTSTHTHADGNVIPLASSSSGFRTRQRHAAHGQKEDVHSVPRVGSGCLWLSGGLCGVHGASLFRHCGWGLRVTMRAPWNGTSCHGTERYILRIVSPHRSPTATRPHLHLRTGTGTGIHAGYSLHVACATNVGQERGPSAFPNSQRTVTQSKARFLTPIDLLSPGPIYHGPTCGRIRFPEILHCGRILRIKAKEEGWRGGIPRCGHQSGYR